MQKYCITSLEKCISDLLSNNKNPLSNLSAAKVNVSTKDVIITTLRSKKAQIITKCMRPQIRSIKS